VTHLVDASFMLALLLKERVSQGAEGLLDGSAISAVNLSEIYRKLIDNGMPQDEAIGVVDGLRLEVIPFESDQAVETAQLRPLTRHLGMSFADRACLALARLRGFTVYTADHVWMELDLGLDIRMIR
jgi:ribonuclease VapC